MKYLFRRTRSVRNQADIFTQLITPHVSALYQTAFKLTGSQADAEDIVQDVLVRLYLKTNELERINELRPWLYRVLYHQFIDHRRRQSRSPVSEVNREQLPDTEIVDSLTGAELPPDKSHEKDRASDRVLQALNTLSPDQRALVVLHLIDGFTLEELTGVLDLPLGTIKSRLHRTKNRLKKVLELEPFAPVERGRDVG